MDYQGWRARLEHSWRLTVDQIVALSVACHELAPPSESGLPTLPALAASSGGGGDQQLLRLVGRLMATHGVLAEIEAALDRIKASSYGICEGCATLMRPDWLDATPHVRTCPDCSPQQARWSPGGSAASSGHPAPRRSDLVAVAG